MKLAINYLFYLEKPPAWLVVMLCGFAKEAEAVSKVSFSMK